MKKNLLSIDERAEGEFEFYLADMDVLKLSVLMAEMVRRCPDMFSACVFAVTRRIADGDFEAKLAEVCDIARSFLPDIRDFDSLESVLVRVGNANSGMMS